VRALIVGLLLAGEIHLFSAEIFHHHEEVTRICQLDYVGGPFLHPGQKVAPLCPICQIVSNGSVRPAVQSYVQKSDQESTYQPVTRQARYSLNLNQSVLARGPPLS
jgi:hypothetical protein